MPFLLTCEHAVNTIPDQFRHLFNGAEQVLDSHRGVDIGAGFLATELSRVLEFPLFSGEVSRLLIELNRSVRHPQLFSEFTCMLLETEKENLIKNFYIPYRTRVEKWIASSVKPVVHLSIHSFTPVFNGLTREVDIGLLFDPERKFERDCCDILSRQLLQDLPDSVIRFNEPYQGVDDGFTTYLRTRFGDTEYAGIELEVNQKYAGTEKLKLIQSALVNAVRILQTDLTNWFNVFR